MRVFLVFFTTFYFSFSPIYAQTEREVDINTYNSFIKGNYKETIRIGKEALAQGIDFYYLRYRLGISYYINQNYDAATLHLEKALLIEEKDPVLLEYLYYAYIYTNRQERAMSLAETFPDALLIKINTSQNIFKTIALEAGFLTTDCFEQYKVAGILGENAFAHGVFYSDVLFANILATNLFSKHFKLDNNISFVQNTANNLFEFADSKPQIYTDKTNYVGWNSIGTYSAKNWNINAGFGLYKSSGVAYTDNMPSTKVTSYTYSLFNYSASVAVGRRFRYFEPTVGASYTNLSSSKITIFDASLTYFPFGNLNLYGNSKLGYVSIKKDKNIIYTQLIGVKISKKVWLEGYGAAGNHLNYITDGGLQVFNTPNQINWYAGANLNFFFQTINFSFGYGLQERESNYDTESSPTSSSTVNYKYNYNLFKAKAIWKF